MRYLIALGIMVALTVVSVAPVGQLNMAQADNHKETIMLIELKTGTVKVKLRDDLAPNHVERIKTLIGEKFYDGIIFHRVIDGFMAQTG